LYRPILVPVASVMDSTIVESGVAGSAGPLVSSRASFRAHREHSPFGQSAGKGQPHCMHWLTPAIAHRGTGQQFLFFASENKTNQNELLNSQFDELKSSSGFQDPVESAR